MAAYIYYPTADSKTVETDRACLAKLAFPDSSEGPLFKKIRWGMTQDSQRQALASYMHVLLRSPVHICKHPTPPHADRERGWISVVSIEVNVKEKIFLTLKCICASSFATVHFRNRNWRFRIWNENLISKLNYFVIRYKSKLEDLEHLRNSMFIYTDYMLYFLYAELIKMYY